jgi:hypothetical protein
MAIDTQTASIQVGQNIPTITSSSQNQFGQLVNAITYTETGLILNVTPRVNDDGLVVMNISATKSDVGPEQEGIPIQINQDGTVIRSPRINITQATTTVHANSGQTVVLGGLITKASSDTHRRVPLISQVPLIGDLFRFDSVREERRELLIIMTPRIIRNELDAELLKQVESSRMNWVLCDVIDLDGATGLRSRKDEWRDSETEAVYPTYIPTEGELVPTPAGESFQGTESTPSLQRGEVDQIPRATQAVANASPYNQLAPYSTNQTQVTQAQASQNLQGGESPQNQPIRTTMDTAPAIKHTDYDQPKPLPPVPNATPY